MAKIPAKPKGGGHLPSCSAMKASDVKNLLSMEYITINVSWSFDHGGDERSALGRYAKNAVSRIISKITGNKFVTLQFSLPTAVVPPEMTFSYDIAIPTLMFHFVVDQLSLPSVLFFVANRDCSSNKPLAGDETSHQLQNEAPRFCQPQREKLSGIDPIIWTAVKRVENQVKSSTYSLPILANS